MGREDKHLKKKLESKLKKQGKQKSKSGRGVDT